jgi:hypothetical protein
VSAGSEATSGGLEPGERNLIVRSDLFACRLGACGMESERSYLCAKSRAPNPLSLHRIEILPTEGIHAGDASEPVEDGENAYAKISVTTRPWTSVNRY